MKEFVFYQGFCVQYGGHLPHRGRSKPTKEHAHIVQYEKEALLHLSPAPRESRNEGDICDQYPGLDFQSSTDFSLLLQDNNMLNSIHNLASKGKSSHLSRTKYDRD
ncbi:hypothetical protein ACJX0J_038520 [Zea mays]